MDAGVAVALAVVVLALVLLCRPAVSTLSVASFAASSTQRQGWNTREGRIGAMTGGMGCCGRVGIAAEWTREQA